MRDTLKNFKIAYNLTYTDPVILRNNTAVGIELELEGNPCIDDLSDDWRAVEDGSLRNGGIEIRCRRPLSGADLEKALVSLTSTLESTSYTLSERCSTHIHIDVSDLQGSQIKNFIALSVMFEHVLFDLFGGERRSNNFCLATDEGGNNYKDFVRLMSANRTIPCILSGEYTWTKYAGIGLYRIRDLGTIEFRMFSPMVGLKEYHNVLNFLFAMKDEAILMSEPSDIIEYKRGASLQQTFYKLFPDLEFNENTDRQLERGIQTLNDILNTAEVIKMTRRDRNKYQSLIESAQSQIQLLDRGI